MLSLVGTTEKMLTGSKRCMACECVNIPVGSTVVPEIIRNSSVEEVSIEVLKIYCASVNLCRYWQVNRRCFE